MPRVIWPPASAARSDAVHLFCVETGAPDGHPEAVWRLEG